MWIALSFIVGATIMAFICMILSVNAYNKGYKDGKRENK